MTRLELTLVVIIGGGCWSLALSAADPPERPSDTDRLRPGLARQVERLTSDVEAQPDKLDLYSQRGDALFFLGRFADAVADYDRMVELDAQQDASHWRRGIALFYAGKFELAAGQFERYHSFDNVDRENGIWRYLSQVKAYGRERAREGLLKYEKDDREPFPDVYQLFAGTMTPEDILQHIADADVDASEREKRLFYAHLYIGLNHAVDDQPQPAREHLSRAAANAWAGSAGYGPRYMWHVARLHRDLLSAVDEKGQSRPTQSRSRN
jgi:lipoprotein NlpI